MLERITGLINDVVVQEDPSTRLTCDDVLGLIGAASSSKGGFEIQGGKAAAVGCWAYF